MRECRTIYKSIRDSLRYQLKKMVTGKSGDSGDEMPNDDATTDSDSNDVFAFWQF